MATSKETQEGPKQPISLLSSFETALVRVFLYETRLPWPLTVQSLPLPKRIGPPLLEWWSIISKLSSSKSNHRWNSSSRQQEDTLFLTIDDEDRASCKRIKRVWESSGSILSQVLLPHHQEKERNSMNEMP